MICPRRCVSIRFNCCLRSSVRCVPHSSCVCCVPPFLITESSHNHFNYSTSQRLGYVSAEHYYVSAVSLLWKPLEVRLIFTAVPPPTAWACTHTRLRTLLQFIITHHLGEKSVRRGAAEKMAPSLQRLEGHRMLRTDRAGSRE